MYYFLNATVESSLIFVLIFLFAKVKTVQDKNDSKRKMKRRKNGKITNGTDEEKTDVTETEEKDIPTERGSSFKITIQNKIPANTLKNYSEKCSYSHTLDIN